MKIIISESQLKYINEALGIPDNILDAAELIYDKITQDIKTIKYKEDDGYEFENNVDITLGHKKKIKIDKFVLKIDIENLLKDGSKPEIISMGMGQTFMFDSDILMKITKPSTNAQLHITFAVADDWEPKDLYNAFIHNKGESISSIAHELKHKYDKQSKKTDLIGKDAEYQATQQYGSFGIPAIDNVFMRYLYYINATESLVRPVEVGSELRSGNISKSQFMDFLNNNRVYKELKEIADYSYEKLVDSLISQMGRVEALLDHADIDYEDMSDEEKINEIFGIVYATLVNTKMSIFVDMTTNRRDEFINMLRQFMGVDENEDKIEKVRRKFFNYLVKFQKDPTQFFKSEIDNFNYFARKMLKKISKLYALAKDDEEVNESILNWDLHQKLMEKKYGKRKIETKINFLKIV